MTTLSKYETILLVNDKLLSIANCVDECQKHDKWNEKVLRHELSQVAILAKRALEIIEEFEPADETTRAVKSYPCKMDGCQKAERYGVQACDGCKNKGDKP